MPQIVHYALLNKGDLAHEPVVWRELLRVLGRAALRRDGRDAVHHGDAGMNCIKIGLLGKLILSWEVQRGVS